MNYELRQKWIKVGIRLSTFPNEKTDCPNCDYGELNVTDISLSNDCSIFERLIFCPSCKKFVSTRMLGKHRYRDCNYELSKEEEQIVKNIKAAASFASRAARK